MSAEKFVELFEDGELHSYIEDLEEENKKQKEIINKTKKAIEKMLYDDYEISVGEYFTAQNEDTAFGVRAMILLRILNDKEE